MNNVLPFISLNQLVEDAEQAWKEHWLYSDQCYESSHHYQEMKDEFINDYISYFKRKE